MKIEYPKWLYHRTHAPKIVDDPEQHDALGDEWKDSPADLESDPEPASEAPELPDVDTDTEKPEALKKRATKKK
jgi:hypothetical protein